MNEFLRDFHDVLNTNFIESHHLTFLKCYLLIILVIE